MIRDGQGGVKTENIASAVPLGWETPIQYLKGVGPRRSDLFRRLGLATVRDLVYHFPRRHEDRRAFLTISQLVSDQKQTVCGVVTSCSLFRARTGTVILSVVVKDSTGSVTALWFNQPYMRKWFPTGQKLILYGNVQKMGRKVQMAAPEFEAIPPESEIASAGAPKPPASLHMGRIVPIYPATSGLHQRELRTAVAVALKVLLASPPSDPLPAGIRERHELLEFMKALKGIHFPAVPEAVAQAQQRLTFDELLCFQLALGIRRRAFQQKPGIAHQISGDLVDRWREQLPFKLT
ncbi:MAG TPA: OB-fold nucleic acid binding domain-containing protein, partial [Sphingomonadales bacterium]|nr:OB-fold nucleic acid binding domain-containing protein [Sphingomonadales bacterium]